MARHIVSEFERAMTAIVDGRAGSSAIVPGQTEDHTVQGAAYPCCSGREAWCTAAESECSQGERGAAHDATRTDLRL